LTKTPTRKIYDLLLSILEEQIIAKYYYTNHRNQIGKPNL